MKLKKEFMETANRTVYKRARWTYLVETGKSRCRCSLCRPHRICNAKKWRDRNWKRHRRNQYREVNHEYGKFQGR